MTELENLYRSYLKGVAKFGPFDRTKWTKFVKTHFAEVGKRRHFAVYANGIEVTGKMVEHREYQLDLIWENRKDGSSGSCQPTKSQLQLAMESEWETNEDEQEDDFYKLVYSKAKWKVFIFRSIAKNDELCQRLKLLVGWANSCKIRQEPRERYLLVSHQFKKSAQCMTVNGFRINTKGQLEHIAGKTEFTLQSGAWKKVNR